MRTVVVRYETKPDRADENQRLVEQVFEELHATEPDGFGYASFRLDDGVSFVHVVVETAEAATPLTEVAAFRAFVENIAERCVQPPVATEATVVGSYRLFGGS